ncbi:MAG: hypothetical protein IPK33_12515 [Gemmatimonadetes bacterium]|nr:hypothetical protein [Gemmatimonadota bacterium]
MLVLVPPSPAAPPSLTGWAFIIGRRTRDALQVVVAIRPTPTTATTPGRVAS